MIYEHGKTPRIQIQQIKSVAHQRGDYTRLLFGPSAAAVSTALGLLVACAATWNAILEYFLHNIH